MVSGVPSPTADLSQSRPPEVFRRSRRIYIRTTSTGPHASMAPTSIALTVAMMASPRSPAGAAVAGCDGLRNVIEPFPVAPVAFDLALVHLAALHRAKLLEVPTTPDQPEGTLAFRISATIAHDMASAFARRIQRMKSSWPLARQERPQYRSRAGFRNEMIFGSSLPQ